MTTPLNARIRIGDAGEVLAAVPHLLGFIPADSLILIGLHTTGDAATFGLTLRLDLPPPEHRRALVEYVSTGPLIRRGITGVIAVVAGSGTAGHDPGGPPPEGSEVDEHVEAPELELIALLREGLAEAGIEVLHELWADRLEAGGSWQCYDDPVCAGRIPDPKRTALGAAMAASGSVTFDSREELQRLVAPESERAVARWSARLAAMIEDVEREPESGRVHRDVAITLAGIRRTAAGEALTEDDQLRILLALSDHRVRDLCLGVALGDSAMAAEQLWLSLVRKAPEPEVAEVGALLAFFAYLRGEGALASVALERVEAGRPEHTLGRLLRQALDTGVSPKEMADMAKEAMTDAQLMIEEEES
ncbi:DUF4192 domain-containing protein [Saccharopolyspora gloriosae]|uniref:DUF4192 domain-containing protein n=1 Tax=Saccharopolyspora gloriosae TaxID=455344 RepID=UPI001FB74C01|nr:DUF4192 domain-containing protein [Saccharopolyspora gloriosae]